MFLQFEKTLTFTTQKVTFKCSLGTWIFIKSHGTQQEIQITVIDPIQFRFGQWCRAKHASIQPSDTFSRFPALLFDLTIHAVHFVGVWLHIVNLVLIHYIISLSWRSQVFLFSSSNTFDILRLSISFPARSISFPAW